ncbi:hypothetical protein [Plastoroseomonas hellenica]|uniref:hypothetical protein n=1 Tax=Plastoroseomonas hellenica TaxID=2687306 RepID=UPI001BAA3533|nr:hypothetical protein [Plastoroseomonas hellenica]MBR0645096.1 hypothetical protein [Plastoroseomonas hellenica]
MEAEPDLAAVAAGVVVALRAMADALIARDFGFQIALEERLRTAIAEIAVTPGSNTGATAVPRGLLAALQRQNRGASDEE